MRNTSDNVYTDMFSHRESVCVDSGSFSMQNVSDNIHTDMGPLYESE